MIAFGFLDGQIAAHDQLLGVDLAQAGPFLDFGVHQRLREGRLVAFVVAVAAVAVHVDDHVLVKSLAEIQGQLGDIDGGLGSSPLTWKIGTSIILATSVQ